MKRIFTILFLSLFFILFFNNNASAIVLEEDSNIAENQIKIQSATNDAPQNPSGSVETGLYYCAVVYTWKAGSGGDKLSVTTSPLYDSVIDDVIYSEISMPNLSNEDVCPMNYGVARSYSSYTGLFSDYAFITDYLKEFDYGYAKCQVKAKDVYRRVQSNKTIIPTSFDQEYFIWEHGGAKNDFVVGTILYNNQVKNIAVQITGMIGTRTSTVNIGDVTFSLRTGPKRCSIKVDKQNVSTSDFHFAFGVRDTTWLS